MADQSQLQALDTLDWADGLEGTGPLAGTSSGGEHRRGDMRERFQVPVADGTRMAARKSDVQIAVNPGIVRDMLAKCERRMLAILSRPVLPLFGVSSKLLKGYGWSTALLLFLGW